jgi:hypothetical protein
MSALTLARRAWMRACRLAASWSGAALVLIGFRGADPVNAQPQSHVTGCPSFHEVHPTITAEEALRRGAPRASGSMPESTSRTRSAESRL